MAASMGSALAGVDFTCHPYTPGGRSGFLQLAERMQLLPRSRPSSTSLLSGFVRLRYALDCGFLPFFLDLPDMRCQLLPARRLAGLSGRRAQVPPSICTSTADFRNRSYEVCN